MTMGHGLSVYQVSCDTRACYQSSQS